MPYESGRLIHLPRFGYFPPHARRFGGGGKTTVMPAVVQPSVTPPAVVEPPTPTITQQPVAAVSPAATATSTEVVKAQDEQRRAVLKRKGFASTVKAGDTGGWSGGASTKPNPMSAGSANKLGY